MRPAIDSSFLRGGGSAFAHRCRSCGAVAQSGVPDRSPAVALVARRGCAPSARSGAATGRVADARAASDAGLDLGVPERAALPVYAYCGRPARWLHKRSQQHSCHDLTGARA
jgi:hypothetical protein